MRFRFRNSIKPLPGIRINLSKSGVSASIGKLGGIPGTGISYSEKLSVNEPSAPGQGMTCAALLGWGVGRAGGLGANLWRGPKRQRRYAQWPGLCGRIYPQNARERGALWRAMADPKGRRYGENKGKTKKPQGFGP